MVCEVNQEEGNPCGGNSVGQRMARELRAVKERELRNMWWSVCGVRMSMVSANPVEQVGKSRR